MKIRFGASVSVCASFYCVRYRVLFDSFDRYRAGNTCMGSLSTKIARPTKMAAVTSSEIQQFIKDAISKDKVVIFSKSYCPYCDMAKQVFGKLKQPTQVYELDERDDGTAIQSNLVQITGLRTVPQVFINGNCVGGGTDVKALHSSGKLEPMLIG